jgi:dienelactone hydrolase
MVLVGAEDVGIPAVPCKALLDAAVIRGAKVDMEIYPGAYHHFDRPNLPRRELPFPTAVLSGSRERIRQRDRMHSPAFHPSSPAC